MNARILALGAMLVLTASALDAQAPKKEKGGYGKGKVTADSAARRGAENDRRDGMSNDDNDRRGRKGQMGGRNGGYLLAGIELTDAQKTRIKAIHESYRTRMDALRDSARTANKDGVRNAADSTFRAHTVTLAASERAEIRTVLTGEQQVRFDQNAKRMDDRMAKRYGARGKGNGKKGDRSGDSRP